MLTLTENAVMAVKSIVADDSDAQSAGLRIHTVDGRGDGFAITAAAAPEAADTVVEEGGARVFLAPETIAALDAETLDAEVDGAGGVRFTLAASA